MEEQITLAKLQFCLALQVRDWELMRTNPIADTAYCSGSMLCRLLHQSLRRERRSGLTLLACRSGLLRCWPLRFRNSA
ncbi:hypothetical protein HDF10_002478 [Edaphobacter lichenicola]|uniref:Uncharacterized protein n=1 Tax=Tunturiibacter lichenicola TaxID=2051959 RepID=A0A7W8J8C4_9BACT|nr:hypothetical protein [Edaphobacter lichenicola]